jgi:hypothetical protein
MLSTGKLTQPSGGRLTVTLMVALAVAVVLSMAFASNAEAKHRHKNNLKAQNTSVFCNAGTFDRCRNTSDPNVASQTFTALSGTPRSNDTSFRSNQTGKVFPSCTFLSTSSGADRYFCQTKKHKNNRHH